MSNGARKKRKRLGDSFEKDAKTPTGDFITRAERQASRRASRRAEARVQAFVAALIAERRGDWL